MVHALSLAGEVEPVNGISRVLENVADSALWPTGTATTAEETAALNGYLLNLCDTIWADIREPGSLAERVRAELAPTVHPIGA